MFFPPIQVNIGSTSAVRGAPHFSTGCDRILLRSTMAERARGAASSIPTAYREETRTRFVSVFACSTSQRSLWRRCVAPKLSRSYYVNGGVRLHLSPCSADSRMQI